MKIIYDPEVDALSIIFLETTVTTEQLAEGIAAEYDSNGQLAGIEILDAVQRFGGKETLRQIESCDVVNLIYNKARSFSGGEYYGNYYHESA